MLEGRDLVLKDLREKGCKYRIQEIHNLKPLTLSVNPNKPKMAITGGKDALIKFWDLRKPGLPLKVLNEQSGWVLGLEYNDYHD